MAYTIPANWAVLQTVPLAKLTPLSADLTFLGTPPSGLTSSGSSTQSVTTGTATLITTMTAAYVNGLSWTANEFTITTAGRYYVSGAVTYGAAVATHVYESLIYQNGTAIATGAKSTLAALSSSKLVVPVRYLIICASGDHLQLYASQASGSSKTAGGRLFVKWISN